MADAIDTATKASASGEKKQKKEKNLLDTPQAREQRIQLYMTRADQKGSNGRFLNLFSGEEYKEDDFIEFDESQELEDEE